MQQDQYTKYDKRVQLKSLDSVRGGRGYGGGLARPHGSNGTGPERGAAPSLAGYAMSDRGEGHLLSVKVGPRPSLTGLSTAPPIGRTDLGRIAVDILADGQPPP